MIPLSRRGFLASAPAFAMQNTRPADAQDAVAPPQRRLLASSITADKLQSALIPRDRWTPYPAASDRAAWTSLPADIRSELLAHGEKALPGPWPAPPANLFLGYVRTGNRSEYQAVVSARRDRLRNLVLAECAEGKGRFNDEIANGVWATCEETWWGYPAHLNLQKRRFGLPDVNEPVIDLFAAEAGNLLAWTDYLVGPQLDRVHPMIRERIALEVDRRILKPYETRSDFWWMGLEANRPMNNWNPWINSNCMSCALLMEGNQGRRARLAYKILTSLDRFLDAYHNDGGCDEGPGYFGHAGGSLYDNLELLHRATNGSVDFFKVPLVKAIGQYIYKVQIADAWYVNFADASARVQIDGGVVYRFGERIGDAKMQALGAEAVQKRPGSGGSLLRVVPGLFARDKIRSAPARSPLPRDSWLPGIQVLTARMEEGSTNGLFLAAQGGHNAESHNHNDVGNFIVYANGKPAIIDVGVEEYTSKTFSAKRYEIWTMQSAYHNCPTVNGVMQAPGVKFAARSAAFRAGEDATELTLDIAAAYPAQAGIEAWKRTFRLDRAKKEVLVRDAYTLQKGGGRVELTLMSALPVQTASTGALLLGGGVKVEYPAEMTPVFEEISTADPRLKPIWGPKVYRVLLKAQNLPVSGDFRIRITA